MRNPVRAVRHQAGRWAGWVLYELKFLAGHVAIYLLPPVVIGLLGVWLDAASWPRPKQVAYAVAAAALWFCWGAWVFSWFVYPDPPEGS